MKLESGRTRNMYKFRNRKIKNRKNINRKFENGIICTNKPGKCNCN